MLGIIVSIDIETDGPIPGQNSMLSLGAVAYDPYGKELSKFYVKLYPLIGAVPDPDTMQWWKGYPEAYAEALRDPQPPTIAMRDYATWFLQFDKAVMLAAPCGFDFTFVRWYLVKFVGADRRWHNCIDLRSVLMWKRGKYEGDYKRDMGIKPMTKHTHNALDDAREQAEYFFAAWRERPYV